MPIYEFICPTHGRFEKILPIVECNNIQLCSLLECALVAEKVFSIPSPPSIGKPIYIFKNPKTGETRTLYKETDRFNPPKGFVVDEVKGQAERLRFEKELNQKQQVDNEMISYQREQMKNATQKNRHDDLNANMSKLDNKSQDLLKAAMARSKKKEFRKKKSEVRIPINHLNKSNLTHG